MIRFDKRYEAHLRRQHRAWLHGQESLPWRTAPLPSARLVRRRLWHAFWRGFVDGMSLGPLRRWWRARRGGAR